MTRPLFASVAALIASEFVFRIQDNGGDTADRYTVQFCDGDYLGMSSYPTHPQGVSLWGEDMSPDYFTEQAENGDAVDMALADLPEAIQRHVVARLNEGFRDFIESEQTAADRESAETYQGLRDDAGKGIYRTPEGFRVKSDNGPEDDHGPFADFVDAVLSTLPTPCSFTGDEYHSPEDMTRTEPSEEVAAAVKALENKVAAKDAGYTVRQTAYGLPGDRWVAVDPAGADLEGEHEDEAKAWAAAFADLDGNS